LATRRVPLRSYRAIHEESGLQCILFQYPATTKANYDLDTQIEIAKQPGVVATKNGVRDMKRWYVEIPALKREVPDLQVLSCHDEWLLPSMFDIDGLLVGYGNVAPELLLEMLKAGRAQDYTRTREIFERLLPVTRTVYHRGSHMEGTVALKIGLVHRGVLDHATVREPLKPLGEAAEREIRAAFDEAGIGRVEQLIAAQ
jgi:4-hydroxy-tetrahydrodipicolinate synthase